MANENPNASRPTITLANENSPSSPTILEQMTIKSAPIKSTQRIPTFWIWSIFNLLFVPFGLLCCYLSYRAGQFKRQDRYQIATVWSKRAFVANLITTLLMFGLIITIVMLRYDYHERNDTGSANQTRTTAANIPWQPGR